MSHFCTDCVVGLVLDNPDNDNPIEVVYEEADPSIDVFEIFKSLEPGEMTKFTPCKGCDLMAVGKDDQDPTKIRVLYDLKPPPTDLEELPWVLYPDRRVNSHFTSHHAKSRFTKMVRLAKQEAVKQSLD